MKFLPFLFSLFLFSITANSQVIISNYANQNNIHAIVEDGNFVLFGTDGGLIKRFKSTNAIANIYTTDDGLISNLINCIALDLNGDIWVGTNSGLSIFSKSSNTWKSFRFPEYGSAVYSIYIDPTGENWIGCLNGLFHLREGNLEYVAYSVSRVNGIAMDSKGKIWFSTSNHGLFKQDIGYFKNYKKTNSGLVDNYISQLACDAYGNVYAGTNKGLAIFDGTIWDTVDMSKGLFFDQIISLAIDFNGNKWVGSTEGMCLINSANVVTEKYKYDTSALPSYGVQSILIDAQNNRWFGTVNGFARYDNAGNWSNSIYENCIPDNRVFSVARDPLNKLWIGGLWGLSTFDGNNWVNYKNNRNIASMSLVIDSKGYKWSGASNNVGISKFNDTSWLYFDTFNSAIVSDRVNSLSIHHDTIWVGTENGISKFYNENTWVNYTNSSTLGELPDDYIRDIAIDKKGVKWINSLVGITSFDGSKWKTYNESDGFPTNNATAICVDENNNKWIAGSLSGIYKYNDTVIVYYPFVGITSINKLAVDLNGTLWIAGIEGIAKFNGQDFVIYNNENYTFNWMNSLFIDPNTNDIWTGSETSGLFKLSCETSNPSFIYDSSCLVNDSAIFKFTNTSSIVDATTQYRWDITDLKTTNTILSKDLNYKFVTDTVYYAILTASNGFCENNFGKKISIHSKPIVKISTDKSKTLCLGDELTANASILNYKTKNNYSYLWNNGTTKDKISISDSGYYFVEVFNEECSSHSDTIHVGVIFPYSEQQICLVTVHPTVNKNMIVWEKPANKNIESFNIYKVIGLSYQLVGNVLFKDIASFIDYSSFPESVSARYAIGLVDSCQNESIKSPYHQTILLGASKGTTANQANLDWTAYEDESGNFKPMYYYIYKGKTKDNIVLIDSVSGFSTKYIDNNFDGVSAYYRIAITKPQLCYPDLLKADSGPYSQSLSNIVEFKTTGIASELLLPVTCFPNPFNENITLDFSLENNSDVVIIVLNSLGQETAVFSYKGLAAGNQQIQLQSVHMNITEGLVYLKVMANNKSNILKANYTK